MTLTGMYEAMPKVIPNVIPTRKAVMPLVLPLKTSAGVAEYSVCIVLRTQDDGKLL